MQTAPLGGPIGPFIDPSTGQQAPARVHGSFTYEAAGDVSAAIPAVQSALLQALTNVIAQKLQAQQVAIPTIEGSLPYFQNEIIAASGAQAHGVRITGLSLSLSVQSPTAVAAYSGPLPPTPMESMQNAFAQQAKDRLDPRNYEYAARVNVGGFKINASTDGGLDTEGLKEQVKDKAKSTVIWWGIGCFIIFLVVVGLAGLAWYVYAEYKSSSAGPATGGTATAAVWDGKSPFSCSGSDHVKIDGVTADLSSGTAVKASGNCRVELTNVTITAPVGIEALSNAQVTVTGGSVTGKAFAAKALGSAKITFTGTAVTGKTQKLGSSAQITGP